MHKKPLSKEQILAAMSKNRSNMACARYLNVSYQHYKKWAKLYSSTERIDPSNPESPFKSLFDVHTNLGGKGIPKFMKGRGGSIDKFPIIDIIEGRISCEHYSPSVIKDSMIREGLLREMCAECGFGERRVSDYKMPLLMYFTDNNKRNYRPENLKLLCYNCYFLFIADIFTPKQELAINDHKSITYKSDFDWDLEEKAELLKKLTAEAQEPRSKDDGMEFVSRI